MTEILHVRQYATKPRIVQAVHWEGSAIEADPIIRWIKTYGGEAEYVPTMTDDDPLLIEHILVVTYHGRVNAYPGDYIYKDQFDQFDVASATSFNAIYEESNP